MRLHPAALSVLALPFAAMAQERDYETCDILYGITETQYLCRYALPAEVTENGAYSYGAKLYEHGKLRAAPDGVYRIRHYPHEEFRVENGRLLESASAAALGETRKLEFYWTHWDGGPGQRAYLCEEQKNTWPCRLAPDGSYTANGGAVITVRDGFLIDPDNATVSACQFTYDHGRGQVTCEDRD